MNLLSRCARELISLFVDDGGQAMLVLAWLVAGCLLLRRWPGEVWTGPALFAGVALIFALGLTSKRR